MGPKVPVEVLVMPPAGGSVCLPQRTKEEKRHVGGILCQRQEVEGIHASLSVCSKILGNLQRWCGAVEGLEGLRL